MPKKLKAAGIRSKERVRSLGEVFTQEREVNAMLDLIPEHVWHDPFSKFLEPACGDGNFLEPILRNKLCTARERFPDENYTINALLALGSIYAIDICEYNVGLARERLLGIFWEHICEEAYAWLTYVFAARVVFNNVVHGDFLKDDIVFTQWSNEGGEIYGQRYHALRDKSKVGEPFKLFQ